MKNLKRLLSLALAGTILSGMMVMGASATDFPDDEKIVNQEAVATMSALNIINGKPDGNYDPEGLVTRAEMAKMISTAVNGGVAPEFGTKPTPTYTDIKGNWAEQFIEYCYDMKYISGRGNGTFDPAGNVTGVEAAKMVLTALGYDETAYQLKGADWAINTNAIAMRTCKPSLYENLNGVNMNVAITRDVAAQIIWNGVQNHIVEWTPNREVTGTGLNYQYTLNPNVTLLNKAYDAKIWIGTFTGNDKFNDSLSKGEIEVVGGLENADRNDSKVWGLSAHFPSEYDIANIGEETKVIFKDGKTGTKNKPDRGDTIYGVFNTGATTVYNTTVGGLGDDEKNDNAKIKFDGSTYELGLGNDNKFTFMANYGKSTAKVLGDFGKFTAEKKDLNAAATAIKTTLKGKVNGDSIKFVADESGKIVAGYMVHSDLAVVLAKNSEKVTLNNNFGSFKIADNDVYEDIKKDDVVVATRLYAEKADDGYTVVEKAEPVHGEVEGFKKQETVTVDGETYKRYGKEADLFTAGLGADAKENFTDLIGEEFDLYLVNGYVRAAVQTTETANNWSVVLEAKGESSTTSVFNGLQLQVMDAEGDKHIITVSNDTSKKLIRGDKGDTTKALATADFPVGSLITYVVDKDKEAVIKNFVKYVAGDKMGYFKDTKTFGDTTTSADCVIFVNTATDAKITEKAAFNIKAYKIRELNDIVEADAIVATNTAGNRVVAAVIDLQNNPIGASSTRVYGIISEDKGTMKVNGVERASYTASVNGEDYTLYLTNDSLLKGDIISFEPSNDNIYAGVNTAVKDGENRVTKIAASGDVAEGWVRDFSEKDSTLDMWDAVQGLDKDGKPTSTKDDIASYKGKGESTTYALTKDTKLYYVDQKNDTSVEAASITEFDPIKGLNNVIVVSHPKKDSKGEILYYIADVVIFETSGDAKIINVKK